VETARVPLAPAACKAAVLVLDDIPDFGVTGGTRSRIVPVPQTGAFPLKLPSPQSGAAGENRTPSFHLTRVALSQLSYGSVVGAEGLEPTSPRLKVEHSAVELRSPTWLRPSDSN
jgi:hypothetical protein